VKRLAALGLAAALALVSCSAGPKPPVPMTGRVIEKGRVDDTARGADVTVAVESGDDSFSPTYVKVAPGAHVTFDITNTGTITHTFTIDPTLSTPGIDKAFGRKGDKATVSVVAPAAGQALVFYCKYHQQEGMQGALYSR
jgi:plastocyanin